MNYFSLAATTLVLIFTSTLCRAETHLHITTGFTPPVSDLYNMVLKEADKRLPDISISFEVLPAERSLILLNQGINDGECCRIPSVVVNEYKNLVAIDVSFFSARFSAFSKNIKTSVNSFEDLKPFSVGTVAGWKIAVIKLEEIRPAEVHILTTPEQLFQMLDQDRLDYGVVGYLSGLESISRFKLSTIHAIEPPLIEKPLYLMLHNKHKNLTPVFNQVLNEMQNDGTISRLYNELIKALN